MTFSSNFSMSPSFGLGNFRFNSMILSLTFGSKTVLALYSISVQNSFSESTSNLLDLKVMKIDADKDRKIVPKIKMAKNLIVFIWRCRTSSNFRTCSKFNEMCEIIWNKIRSENDLASLWSVIDQFQVWWFYDFWGYFVLKMSM